MHILQVDIQIQSILSKNQNVPPVPAEITSPVRFPHQIYIYCPTLRTWPISISFIKSGLPDQNRLHLDLHPLNETLAHFRYNLQSSEVPVGCQDSICSFEHLLPLFRSRQVQKGCINNILCIIYALSHSESCALLSTNLCAIKYKINPLSTQYLKCQEKVILLSPYSENFVCTLMWKKWNALYCKLQWIIMQV